MSLIIKAGERVVAQLEDSDMMPANSWRRLFGVSQYVFDNAAYRALHYNPSKKGKPIHENGSPLVLFKAKNFPDAIRGFQMSKIGHNTLLHEWAQGIDTHAPKFEVTSPRGIVFSYRREK